MRDEPAAGLSPTEIAALEQGRVALEGPAAAVRSNPAVIEAYLGRRSGGAPS